MKIEYLARLSSSNNTSSFIQDNGRFHFLSCVYNRIEEVCDIFRKYIISYLYSSISHTSSIHLKTLNLKDSYLYNQNPLPRLGPRFLDVTSPWRRLTSFVVLDRYRH